MRRHALLAVAIAGLALSVRLAGLGDRLSADEGYTWLVSAAPSFDALLDRLAAYENSPPLHYVLTAPLPAGDEAWLRLPALLAGLAAVAALYAAVRPLGGRTAALLAALALAVAPYAVSFSNYARGFALADLGLVVALAAVVRLGLGGSRGWWAVYGAGAGVALWSQYDAALFLAALLAVLAASRRRSLREVVAFGALPALTLLPWLPELLRGLDALDRTKVAPVYPGPSPASLRDAVAALAFGEHGSADSSALRWLQAAIVAGVLLAAARLAAGPPRGPGAVAGADGRLAVLLVGGTLVGTLALHALAAVIGPDLFHQRYLTELVPLACALGALGAVRVRRGTPVAAVALVLLGVAVFVQRHDRELEPDAAALARLIDDPHRRVVATNSAVVAYYLRDLDPVLDRPFGLGDGIEASCGAECRAAFAVVDDTRVAGGARAGRGMRRRAGPYVVRLAQRGTRHPYHQPPDGAAGD